MQTFATATILLALGAFSAWAGKDEDDRLKEATATLSEMAGAGDKGIPTDLMNKAVCAVVVPGVKKAGFIVGAKYGRGFASCRDGKADGVLPQRCESREAALDCRLAARRATLSFL